MPPIVNVEITVPSPRVLEEDNEERFATWESTNEYPHGRYGYGAAILESEPSRADVVGLKEFYNKGSDEDKFMVDSAWYKHPQFQSMHFLDK